MDSGTGLMVLLQGKGSRKGKWSVVCFESSGAGEMVVSISEDILYYRRAVRLRHG